MSKPNHLPLYGLLLCGGRSSRMGQDKARLLLHGQSLLQRGLERLRAAGCQQVWAAGDYPDVPSLPDLPCYQGRGPLAGLASALMWAPVARWLVIPVDMPGLEAELLQTFLQLAADTHIGAALQHNQFPLLLASPAALAGVQQLLADPNPGAASVGALIRLLGITQIADLALTPPEQAAITLCNTNTPQEWQAFCRAQPARRSAVLPTHTEPHSLFVSAKEYAP